ncbi:hypothetical protein PA598K_01779 [Paenibacillus sp. 598K]|uniref:AraC family transcriptional regulator n=1 Tax=Paenibacillus sp. 598K TaxID=1117987 RepID=UPI000FF948E8|nr:AraC family transcriptional regulator [Paenibacillus sp. 598K]GBF73487.1 hypothetical protein PA598K_01779 [Paenibacillus sp. 598K]
MLEYRFRETVRHGSSELPLAVYHVDSLPGETRILPLHWHEEIELISIRRGEGIFTIHHQDYALRAGESVIVNAGELHCGSSEAGCDYTAIVFKLSWLSALYSDRCQREYLHPLLGGELLFPTRIAELPVAAAAHASISRLIDAYDRPGIAREWAIKGQLYSLLAELSPYLVPRLQYDNTHRSAPERWKPVIDVLEYITRHYQKPLTLDELATVGSMTSSHLCRLFKQLTGSRPIEYMNYLRVNRAASMLESGDCSILEAAMDNGYQHLSYFARQFKKFKHMTPSDYKRQALQTRSE